MLVAVSYITDGRNKPIFFLCKWFIFSIQSSNMSGVLCKIVKSGTRRNEIKFTKIKSSIFMHLLIQSFKLTNSENKERVK